MMIIPAENIVEYLRELITGMNGIPKRTISAVLHKKLGYSRHNTDLIIKSLKLENFASEDASEGWIYPIRREYKFDLTETGGKNGKKRETVASLWAALQLAEYTLPQISIARYPYDYIVRADNKVYRFIVFDNDGEYKLRHAAEELQQTVCPVQNIVICINSSAQQVKRLLAMDMSLDRIAESLVYAEVKCDDSTASEVKIVGQERCL